MKTALIAFLMSQPISDFDRQFVLATAVVESRYQVHIRGDGGRSWGLYQFGEARWLESGSTRADWGRANLREQTQAMLRVLDKYKKTMPTGLSRRQQCVWLTNHHNAGHGSLALTPHVVKVLKAFPAVRDELKAAGEPKPPAPVARRQSVPASRQPYLTARAR